MKNLFVYLLLLFGLSAGTATADIVITTIYAGPTPLKSDCPVTQTGPMELTVSRCSWTTTGTARVFSRIKSLPAQIGLGDLGQALREGKAEWLPGHQRVRAWLRDDQGNIIDRSRTRVLPGPAVLAIVPGNWVVYMVDGAGATMDLMLRSLEDTQPPGMIDYLILSLNVPPGTTDLSTVKIEVFKVLSGSAPDKGTFEK